MTVQPRICERNRNTGQKKGCSKALRLNEGRIHLPYFNLGVLEQLMFEL